MAEKKLLLGDEAIALGAIHAGISGVYAYPGTPSTEITEFIQNNPLAKERKLHSTWCTNEKTAMEAALGMSYAGKRALVCMKHVGMNVAADAFVNSAITGVNGGLVGPILANQRYSNEPRYAYILNGHAYCSLNNIHIPFQFERIVLKVAVFWLIPN